MELAQDVNQVVIREFLFVIQNCSNRLGVSLDVKWNESDELLKCGFRERPQVGPAEEYYSRLGCQNTIQ